MMQITVMPVAVSDRRRDHAIPCFPTTWRVPHAPRSGPWAPGPRAETRLLQHSSPRVCRPTIVTGVPSSRVLRLRRRLCAHHLPQTATSPSIMQLPHRHIVGGQQALRLPRLPLGGGPLVSVNPLRLPRLPHPFRHHSTSHPFRHRRTSHPFRHRRPPGLFRHHCLCPLRHHSPSHPFQHNSRVDSPLCLRELRPQRQHTAQPQVIQNPQHHLLFHRRIATPFQGGQTYPLPQRNENRRWKKKFRRQGRRWRRRTRWTTSWRVSSTSPRSLATTCSVNSWKHPW